MWRFCVDQIINLLYSWEEIKNNKKHRAAVTASWQDDSRKEKNGNHYSGNNQRREHQNLNKRESTSDCWLLKWTHKKTKQKQWKQKTEKIERKRTMGSWGEPVLVGEVVHSSHENIDLNLHSLQTRKTSPTSITVLLIQVISESSSHLASKYSPYNHQLSPGANKLRFLALFFRALNLTFISISRANNAGAS